MNPSKLIILLCIDLLAVLTVAAFYFDSKNEDKTGFSRLIPAHPFQKSVRLELDYDSYYIAGITGSRIFLGNKTAPLHMLSTNHDLTDLRQHTLSLTSKRKTLYQALQLRIDSPYVYLYEGITPTAYRGMLTSLKLSPVEKIARLPLMSMIPISRSNYIIRSFDSTTMSSALGKLHVEPYHLQKSKRILTRQLDGFFCTDGMLNFDARTSRFAYVYYYRNQYLLADSSLAFFTTGRTIDTNSIAKIKVAHIGSQNKTTMSAPPLTVNRKSCLDGERLYIVSALISTNELKANFDKNSVIDVYSLSDRRYEFSFYIPDLGNNKISSFQVRGKNVFVLQGHLLSSYSLNL